MIRTETVRGRELRVSVRPGDGSRTPLLLLNGIGAALEILEPFVRELDPALEVIRFDVPGVGGSPLPPRPYHFTTLASLIAELLDRLGHDQVDVLGISWGGGLAQQFAFQHAGRCRRLVLVATGTGTVMVPANPKVLWRMISPRRHRDPEYATSIAGETYGGVFRADPARVRHVLHDDHPAGTRRGYLYQLVAGWAWTSLPLLPFISPPTLVLASDDDPIIPLVNARIMRRLLPRGRLHVHHGGHLALLTEATELAPLVDGFLQEPDP